MRLLTILVLLFSTIPTIGQNYQPINSNSLQAFYQIPSFHWDQWSENPGNMWGTRIDSIDVLINGDTLYYNYPVFRDTTPPNVSCNCSWWNSPNWNGVLTKIGLDGRSWFYNNDGDSIRLDYASELNDEWLCYQYANGDSLIAQVVDVFWSDDGWVTDSVKTIGFTHYSNGLPIADGISSSVIELYKNAGFRKLLDFERFPFDTTSIYQVDVNCINSYSPGYESEGDIRPLPEVNDGFYYIKDCYQQGLTCYNNGHISEQILETETDTSTGQITATILRNVQPEGFPPVSSTVDVIYTPLPDSFVTLYTELNQGNRMPLEGNAMFRYSLEPILYGDTSCHGPSVFVTYPQAEYTGKTLRYAPYVGQIEDRWVESDSWCTAWAIYDHYYSYISVANVSCGQPLMVGIDETLETTFNLYPNPATETVQIQLNKPEEAEVLVTDVLGRTVFNEIPRFARNDNLELDISGWSNGIYLVFVINQKGIRRTQRLVVQH